MSKGGFIRSEFRTIGLAFLLVFAGLTPARVFAWGNTGHEAIAWIAWGQLTPDVQTRVLALLQQVPAIHSPDGTHSIPGYSDWVAQLPGGLSQDDQNRYLFMRAATWADSIKHEGLQDSDTPPPGITADVNVGFTDTASHGYWHFIDTAFASDNSTVPPTPLPNVVTQITAFRGAIASDEDDVLKAYDMIWLEHLVGDIHQPLHATTRYFAGVSDTGGNGVKIKLGKSMQRTFEGTLSKSAPTELHAFWDDLPGEGDAAAALSQAAAFATGLSAAAGTAVADTDPNDWAQESFTLAQSDAYHSPIGPGPKPSTGTAYMISQSYYNQALQDAQTRIALAGARLAKLLNENLK